MHADAYVHRQVSFLHNYWSNVTSLQAFVVKASYGRSLHARPLNVYDGVRHFLFIMPAFALLGAEPLGMLLEHCDSLPRAFRWASVMLISLSAVPSMVALHT